jgi:hypothetical protein
MTERDELISRLESAADVPAPGLSDERRAAIEARIDTMSVGSDDGRRRVGGMWLAAAAVSALIVIGAVVTFADRGAYAELDSASGTVAVELPNGDTVAGTAGTELPDGAVLDIGPDATATVDGVALGPGRYAIVDGRAEQLVDVTTTTTTVPTDETSTTTSTTPAETDATQVGTPSRTTVPDAVARTTTTSVRDRPATTPSTRPGDGPNTTRLDSTTTTVASDRGTVATTSTVAGDRSRDR